MKIYLKMPSAEIFTQYPKLLNNSLMKFSTDISYKCYFRRWILLQMFPIHFEKFKHTVQ